MLKGQSGLKHGNRSKRQALKSASTDLGTADVGKWQKCRPQGKCPSLPSQYKWESQLRVGAGRGWGNGVFFVPEQAGGREMT